MSIVTITSINRFGTGANNPEKNEDTCQYCDSRAIEDSAGRCINCGASVPAKKVNTTRPVKGLMVY